MIDQLEKLQQRFEQLSALMSRPEATDDLRQYAQLSKEHKGLQQVVRLYAVYKKNLADTQEAQELLATEKAPEFKELAKEELAALATQRAQLESQLQELLIPRDPSDGKNSVLELRAGTGGDEAALWVGDLFRMYQRLAERRRWKLQLLDHTDGPAGGYKEIICLVRGQDVYAQLKYESGVHRVQRIPSTETQGRVHTSAASVAVLPEMDAVEVDIDMSQVRKDTFCSSGPGGQSVNTTYSAVRLTHLPTGIVVSCQDGKSQLKNFEKALQVLRSRLYQRALKEQQEQVGSARKSMVGSGDRSEKIRTYNYPQGRVTDHRIGLTQHNLTAVLDGALEPFTQALRMAERTRKMQGDRPALAP